MAAHDAGSDSGRGCSIISVPAGVTDSALIARLIERMPINPTTTVGFSADQPSSGKLAHRAAAEPTSKLRLRTEHKTPGTNRAVQHLVFWLSCGIRNGGARWHFSTSLESGRVRSLGQFYSSYGSQFEWMHRQSSNRLGCRY